MADPNPPPPEPSLAAAYSTFSATGAVALAIGAALWAESRMPWWLLFGIAAYGALSYLRLFRLRLERSGAGDAYRLDRPSLRGVMPDDVAPIQEGYRAAQAVLSEIAEGPEMIRTLFEGTAERARDLYERHTALVRRRAEIRSYLSDGRLARLEKERADLAAKLSSVASDERAQAEEAIRGLEKEIAAEADLARDAGEIDAKLAAIRDGLEGARAEIKRARLARSGGAGEAGQPLSAALDSLSTEVKSFASAVDEVFGRAAPPASGRAPAQAPAQAQTQAQDSRRRDAARDRTR